MKLTLRYLQCHSELIKILLLLKSKSVCLRVQCIMMLQLSDIVFYVIQFNNWTKTIIKNYSVDFYILKIGLQGNSVCFMETKCSHIIPLVKKSKQNSFGKVLWICFRLLAATNYLAKIQSSKFIIGDT